MCAYVFHIFCFARLCAFCACVLVQYPLYDKEGIGFYLFMLVCACVLCEFVCVCVCMCVVCVYELYVHARV